MQMLVTVVYKHYKFTFVKRDCNFFLFINSLVKSLERKNEFKEWHINRKKITIIFLSDPLLMQAICILMLDIL